MLEREDPNLVDAFVLSKDSRLQRVLITEETVRRIDFAGGLSKMKGEKITVDPLGAKSVIPMHDILIEYELDSPDFCDTN